jgi:hypothetical protein
MVEILWSFDYWDGPIAGLCRYDGRLAWFSCVALGGWRLITELYDEDGEDDDCCWTPRVYRVHRLSWFRARYLLFARWLFRLLNRHRRTATVWYRYLRPAVLASRKPVVGAFSDSECFGR